MSRTKSLLLLYIVLLAVPPKSSYAATLDCAGGIISDGDRRADLLAKCGEPDAKESHDEEIGEHFNTGSSRRIYVTVEDWIYDFGPNQLQRIVTLRNGQVTDIRTGKNYGYSKNSKPGQGECTEQLVSRGDSKNDVLSKCGEPTWQDSHQEELLERLDTGQVRKLFVVVDEWTYDLGPNRFVRIFTFRNGKLVDIRTGNYGYEQYRDEKRKTP